MTPGCAGNTRNHGDSESPPRNCPDDVLERVLVIAGSFLEADAELTRLHGQVNGATGEERQALSKSICGLRADALAHSREAFGADTFDQRHDRDQPRRFTGRCFRYVSGPGILRHGCNRVSLRRQHDLHLDSENHRESDGRPVQSEGRHRQRYNRSTPATAQYRPDHSLRRRFVDRQLQSHRHQPRLGALPSFRFRRTGRLRHRC
jgi:hypothetical protein